jgi:hypothetical protein
MRPATGIEKATILSICPPLIHTSSEILHSIWVIYLMRLRTNPIAAPQLSNFHFNYPRRQAQQEAAESKRRRRSKMSKSYTTNPPAPVALSFEAIDELIYNARLGDISGLKDEISKSAAEHNVSASTIIRSALDTEDESEGGTGACLLHWPAANGNVGMLPPLLLCQERSERLTNGF